MFNDFSNVITVIYEGEGWASNVSREVLVYSHADELVDFRRDDRRKIELTAKGKFFVKNFLNK